VVWKSTELPSVVPVFLLLEGILQDVKSKYIGYPESKFRWAIEKKIISEPFIRGVDKMFVH
jgi:hypothetical protein